MVGEFEGRIGLITGAGSGIGREAAMVFRCEGAGVSVANRHLAAAQDTMATLRRAGGEAVAIEMDDCDEDSVRSGIERCVAVIDGSDPGQQRRRGGPDRDETPRRSARDCRDGELGSLQTGLLPHWLDVCRRWRPTCRMTLAVRIR